MKFILLTLQDDTPILINTSRIQEITQHETNPSYSDVWTIDDEDSWEVKESVRTIRDLIVQP